MEPLKDTPTFISNHKQISIYGFSSSVHSQIFYVVLIENLVPK